MDRRTTQPSADHATSGSTDAGSVSWDELSESRQSQVPLVRYTGPRNDGDASPPTFRREESGRVLIPAADLDALLRDNEEHKRMLKEQRATVSTTAADPHTAQLTAYHYEAMLTVMREKQAISERLAKAEEELSAKRTEALQLQLRLKDTDKELTKRVRAYHKLQAKIDTLTRIKKLFTKCVVEVHQAQCKLRQPKLRPKAAKGCLNCGTEGHSWRSCPRKDSGAVFCHVCNAIGFTAEDCPWPHYREFIDDSVPLSLRCKTCRRLLSEPDPACGPCRQRIIEQAIEQRLVLALEYDEKHKKAQVQSIPVECLNAYFKKLGTSAMEAAAASSGVTTMTPAASISSARADTPEPRGASTPYEESVDGDKREDDDSADELELEELFE